MISEKSQYTIAGSYLIIWCVVKFINSCREWEVMSLRAILDIIAVFIAILFVGQFIEHYKD